MGKTQTFRYDAAEHLRSEEEMALYLQAIIDESDGDAALIAKALGDVARARGMSQIARESGLSRSSLYRALSGESNIELGTVLKVSRALGLKWHVVAGS